MPYQCGTCVFEIFGSIGVLCNVNEYVLGWHVVEMGIRIVYNPDKAGDHLQNFPCIVCIDRGRFGYSRLTQRKSFKFSLNELNT